MGPPSCQVPSSWSIYQMKLFHENSIRIIATGKTASCYIQESVSLSFSAPLFSLATSSVDIGSTSAKGPSPTGKV